jgi:hypothetical protein
MPKHSAEPWNIDGQGVIHVEVLPTSRRANGEAIPPLPKAIARTIQGYGVSLEENIANGKRIIAAVNATAGIPTKELEAGVIGDLKNTLQRLSDKTARANAIQHSGGHIDAEDWAELYQLTNEARALLARLKGE